jgi:hypothetical protein
MKTLPSNLVDISTDSSQTVDMIRLQKSIVVLLAICGLGQNQANAEDIGVGKAEQKPLIQERIAEIDQALFLKLADLARFNIRFQLQANHHQRWRQLTYPISRESGTAVSFAATLIDIRQQVRGIDNLRSISKPQLKKAVGCAIIGNAISGGASALELVQNTAVMMKAKEHGYSPARSLSFVKDVVAETDRHFAARDELTRQSTSAERRAVMELETRLIRRIRQQLLFEFVTWSCHSRDEAWRENTFFAIDAMQSFTRMSAGMSAMRAFAHPEAARSATILALVSNSVATVNPIFRNLVGVTMRNYQQRKLAAELPFDRPDDSTELDELQHRLSTETDQSWLRRAEALSYRTGKLDIALDREADEIQRYRQVAQQQSIVGPMIGLTGVTSSILSTVAVYGYRRKPITTLKLGLAGRTTQCTGQSFALIYTPYAMITGLIRNQRLKKHGELPTQILEERLKRLDAYAISVN